MGCLGMHFALGDREVSHLRNLKGDEAKLDFLYEDLEEDFWADFPEFVAQTDKAWDGIHRALTDGELGYDQGAYPLSHVVMGGERIYFSADHILVLKSPGQVRDAALALPGISKDLFRSSYFRINPDVCGYAIDEIDFDYTWHWFEELRHFWSRVAENGRHVLFSASQ